MILEKGDMWCVFGHTDLFLFTANPIVNSKGLAVMGRGIAKQMANRYPEVQREFGWYLQIPDPPGKTHNVDRLLCVDNQMVGFFMVKDHWRHPANPNIIEESVIQLSDMVRADRYDRVDLNFPGIGNGKLKREDVLPIVQQLPDNVHIWEYSDE